MTHNTGKIILENHPKTMRAFEQFWDGLAKHIVSNTRERKELDEQLAKYRKETFEVDTKLSQFQEYLRTVPIASAVGHWIQANLSDPLWQEKYSTKIEKLQTKQLIPYKDKQGNFVTLAYFMQHGHQNILEEIRCVKEWSLLEKEENVRCYVQFSHNLARCTHGLIQEGFDQDRDRVRYKIVKYESFIDFVTHLSTRDALIAKLLYFGAPTLDELLSLKTSAIDTKRLSIQFDNVCITFPKHLIVDLIAYLDNKDTKPKIVFTNVRGAEVERAHLNQSFTRACEKMSLKEKITPGLLLRHEHAQES